MRWAGRVASCSRRRRPGPGAAGLAAAWCLRCGRWGGVAVGRPSRARASCGDDPAAVADGQGGWLGGLDDPAAAADLQRLGGGAAQDRRQQGRRCLEPGGQVPLWPRPWWPGAAGAVMVGGVAGDQDPADGPVAGQPPTRLGVQGAAVADEAARVHRARQLGPDPTGLGEVAGFQGAAGQFGEGGGAALAAAAGIVGVGWAGQGFQGGQQAGPVGILVRDWRPAPIPAADSRGHLAFGSARLPTRPTLAAGSSQPASSVEGNRHAR